MSVQNTASQPIYPVTMTTTTDATATTTTATTTTTTTTYVNFNDGNSHITPTVSVRPIGQHAKTFRLNWDDPSERSRYLELTCLPEVHAAVVNDDWQTAEKILSEEDIPVFWRSASSRESNWLAQLSNPEKQQQQSAITDMAAHIFINTSIEGAGCVHGSHLLTLALQKGAPMSFLRKLVDLTEQHFFSFLSRPDASGRTPLYIAVDRGDKEQVGLLLNAGADPLILCNFEGEGVDCVNNSNFQNSDASKPKRMSAYLRAMDPDKSEIFSLFVEKLHAEWISEKDKPRPSRKRSEIDFILSLRLGDWVARNSEDTIRALGDRVCNLKTYLFNATDCTGTSIVYRQMKNRQPLDKGVTFATNIEPNDWPICKAAASQDTKTFFNEFEILMKNDPSSLRGLLHWITRVFIKRNTEESIRLLVERCPVIAESIYSLIYATTHGSRMAYEVFAPSVKAAWPALTIEKKISIFQISMHQENPKTALVLSLGGFHFDQFYNAYQDAIYSALAYGNRAASEYLAKHLNLFDQALKNISKFNNLHTIDDLDGVKCMLMGVLKSGNKSQFEKLIIGGLDLKKFINCDIKILPLLADCYPNNVEDWIAGMNITASERMIPLAQSTAGQSILKNLLETKNTN